MSTDTDLASLAYDATSRAAWEIVKSITDEIERMIKDDEITDEEEISDRLHELIDWALTYTRDQYICVWGLRDETDCIEQGTCEPRNFSDVLASQAFMNLGSACSRDWSTELQVASDAREERGES